MSVRRFISALLLPLVLATAAGCGQQSSKPEEATNKLKVVASFYPMYEFATMVGGDKVSVVNLVSPGTEPHDWEPTAGDMKTLNQASLFVYNGAGLEHWVDKTIGNLDNKSLVTVETSHGVELIEGHDDQQVSDPHVWLDPLGAIHQVEAIRDGLIKVDPANKATYEANAAAYIGQLKGLDQEFRTALTTCGTKRFFTSHAAFGYLAKRYGIEQHAIMGLAPDAEPTPKDLAQIIAEAKKENVKYIFFETLVSDKVAKVVANEIKANTLVLNPVEGLTEDELKAGKSFLSVMRDNLTNLKTALECK